MKQFKTGSEVKWNWASGTGKGEVIDSYTEKVSKQIDGNEITRNADSKNPAYLIEQSDGQQVLKSHSELEGTN